MSDEEQEVLKELELEEEKNKKILPFEKLEWQKDEKNIFKDKNSSDELGFDKN